MQRATERIWPAESKPTPLSSKGTLYKPYLNPKSSASSILSNTFPNVHCEAQQPPASTNDGIV